MNWLTLGLALSYVGLAAIISRYQELGLEKELAIGVIRTAIQLTIVGYILTYIFDSQSKLFIIIMIVLMTWVAARNASRRGEAIAKAQLIALISIGASELFSISFLILTRIIPTIPQYVIPLSGMIIGNSMVAAGVTLNRLGSEFKLRKEEVVLSLSLGATPKVASSRIIKESIRAGMIPTIDSMKTVGLVQLPGMMTGQILAGADPINAVKYQILIMFIISGATAITSLLVIALGYKKFFTPFAQLK